MINTEGLTPYDLYFRQIDLFSDLSRNTTSSLSSPTSSNDLFENEDPEVQNEDPEVQGNIGSESEIEGLQDGSEADVNQTSSLTSPTSSNELSEPEENTESESDSETNLNLNSENDVSIGDSGNSDSVSNSSLTKG
jgi:hypothetical protein